MTFGNDKTKYEPLQPFKVIDTTKSNCLHDACIRCRGTGKDDKGQFCVHFISCSCPKCAVTC